MNEEMQALCKRIYRLRHVGRCRLKLFHFWVCDDLCRGGNVVAVKTVALLTTKVEYMVVVEAGK